MTMTERVRTELELIEIILEGDQGTDNEKVQEALEILKRILK